MPNSVPFNESITFSVIIDEVNIEIIVANTNDIDLFGNFGISLFSSLKNTFKPFFMNIVVMYIDKNIIIKLINITL